MDPEWLLQQDADPQNGDADQSYPSQLIYFVVINNPKKDICALLICTVKAVKYAVTMHFSCTNHVVVQNIYIGRRGRIITRPVGVRIFKKAINTQVLAEVFVKTNAYEHWEP